MVAAGRASRCVWENIGCLSRSTLARVAGCVHMSPSIAGANTTGAEVARQVATTVSLAMPFAIAPSQRAVAGATTRRSPSTYVQIARKNPNAQTGHQ